MQMELLDEEHFSLYLHLIVVGITTKNLLQLNAYYCNKYEAK